MNDSYLITLHPKYQILNGKWGPILDSVLRGHVVFIPNIRQEAVASSLKRPYISKQGYAIRTSGKEGGTVAWLTKR